MKTWKLSTLKNYWVKFCPMRASGSITIPSKMARVCSTYGFIYMIFFCTLLWLGISDRAGLHFECFPDNSRDGGGEYSLVRALWTIEGFWPPTDPFCRGYSIYIWRNTWDLKQTFCLAALSERLLSRGCLGHTVSFSLLLGEKKNKKKRKKDTIIGALIEDQSHLTSS